MHCNTKCLKKRQMVIEVCVDIRYELMLASYSPLVTPGGGTPENFG